MVIVLFERPLA